MAEELLTPESASMESIKSIFDAAFMQTSLDKDGDVVIQDQVKCYIFLNKAKDMVELTTQFSFTPGSSLEDRLRAVNRINTEYIIVRAAVAGAENQALRFQWHIPLSGGITKKTLVLAVKRFCSIPRPAITDCANEIVQ